MGENIVGTSALNEQVKNALVQGFANAEVTVTDVVVLSIGVVIGVILLVQATKFGIKWLKGVFKQAS